MKISGNIFLMMILSVCFVVLYLFVFASFSQTRNEPYNTLGPQSCGLGKGNCHQMQGNWWEGADAHYFTVDKFYTNPNYRNQAEAYMEFYYADNDSFGREDYLNGRTVCAECHGTVQSSRSAKDMDTGVSCENCHGPASRYQKPHQDKKYQYLTALGQVNLRDLTTRAQTCAKCHYISGERYQKLLRAGHKSGYDSRKKFDYATGIQRVAKHWRIETSRMVDKRLDFYLRAMNDIYRVSQIDSLVASIYGGNQNLQGPTPQFIIVGQPPPDFLSEKRITIEEPFPKISDTTSVEQILMIVKKRIELIHEKIKKANKEKGEKK